MIFRKKKENFFKRFYSHKIFISIVGLAIIIFISIPMAKNVSKRYTINQEISKLQNEINDIEKKNNELSKLTEYLESDQFITEQARLNLNYKKQGEEMIVIKDKDALNTKIEDDNKNTVFEMKGINNDQKKPASNPFLWWNYFFNKNQI